MPHTVIVDYFAKGLSIVKAMKKNPSTYLLTDCPSDPIKDD